MNAESQILEKWIEKVADSHPQNAAAIRAQTPDPFRNPVGYAIRASLSQLWEQLLGKMETGAVDRALDTILRIRALQDISPGEAVTFITDLQPLICQLPDEPDRALLEARIDRLALAASDKYQQCCEQVAAVRLHEVERLSHAHRMPRKARP